MLPSTVAPSTSSTAVVERIDAWLCPKCSKPNRIGSTFCQSCGTTLSQTCGNCGASYETKAAFCPSCGFTPDRVERQRALREKIQQKQTEINTLANQSNTAKMQAQVLDVVSPLSIGWAVFMFGIVLPYMVINGMSGIIGLLRTQPANYQLASNLSSFATFGGVLTLFVVWIATMGVFVYVMMTRLKLNLPALGAYAVLSILGSICGGVNLLFPMFVACTLTLGSAVVVYKYEMKVWLAVGIAALLFGMQLIFIPLFSTLPYIGGLGTFLAIIPHVILAGLLGLVGFRAWTAAELEGSRVSSATNEITSRSARSFRKELDNLNQELNTISIQRRT